MAEKFPSLPTTKQRAFGLDMALFGDEGRRAALVVAERRRLSLHWSRADGTWGVATRTHDDLRQAPRSPDTTAALGWSGRVGVAAAGDHVVLVYKRRFEASNTNDVFIDPFVADTATGDLRGLARPLRLPRTGLGFGRVGFSIWSDLAHGRLLIILQADRAGADEPPTLVLLSTSWPKPDVAMVENAAEWTITTLDSGGWDFDARREGTDLAVLHRRQAVTHAVDFRVFDPGFGASVIPLSDADNAPIRLSQLRRPGVTLVKVDLASHAVTDVDTDLGFGENPKIHSLSPLIATVDWLERGTIVVSPGLVRLTELRSETRLLMRTRRGWRTAPLFAQPHRWANTRESFARVHVALAFRPADVQPGMNLSWAPLWTERPTLLFGRDDTDKGTRLTFAHQDPERSALRATTFRVFEDDGGESLKAMPEEFALLDLGHRHVRGPQVDDREPDEHRQLRPHRVVSGAFHADVPNEGLRVVREENSGNTFAGTIAAVSDQPASGYAYTDMGDGGVRVVFESDLVLPPPTASIDEKEFQPHWVAEAPRPGRAWVRLTTPGFVDTRLPGVFAPPTLLTPVSLACIQQQALDGLALAADVNRSTMPVSPVNPLLFAFGGSGRVGYSAPPEGLAGESVSSVIVTEEAAAELQGWVTANSAPAAPRPAVSAGDQPFRIELRRLLGQVFAGDAVEFEVRAPGVDTAGFEFAWAFSDGGVAAGIRVSHVFARTRPDFSRANPGGVSDPHTITVTATAPDGRVSTVATTLHLEGSLWATLWTPYSAFRKAPDDVLDDDGDWNVTEEEWASFLTPGMFVRDVTMSFYRYSLRFIVDATGRGTRVELTIDDQSQGRFRFLGDAAGQGDIEYEVPVRARLNDIEMTGTFGSGLGAFVRIDRVDATIRCRQRFTAGVQTSERRLGGDDSEALLRRELLRPVAMIPSALCALPVERLTHLVDEPEVEGGLGWAGWALGVVVPALIAAFGTVALLVVLFPLLIAVAPITLGLLTVALVVSLLIGAGAGAVATFLIDRFLVRPLIRSTIRDQLATPETAAALLESGLITHAGEGLCEAIAIALIRQAQADGHPVVDPDDSGRNRFRSPFFETIVVSQNECKAHIRV